MTACGVEVLKDKDALLPKGLICATNNRPAKKFFKMTLMHIKDQMQKS